MKRCIFIVSLVLCALLGGCKTSKALLPNISGKAGEVLVVIGRTDWEGQVGTELRDNFCADCPFLPQKEPLYSLVNVNPAGFSKMFQLHRNIIIIHNSAEVQNPGVDYKYDKWAKSQIVITVNARSSEECAEIIASNVHTMINAVEQVERNRVIDNTRKYQARELPPVVKELTGGTMVFPSGYELKKKTDDFIWISYETTYVQQGIFVYVYPAQGVVEELSREALVAKRNEVLKEEVPGMVEGSYMTTSTVLEPAVKYASYHDRKFAEIRGFWDVHGDFMGGPFVSHTFYTPDGKNLICLEAYVYAPKFDKRLYLRQVESLLYSFEF